MKNRLLLIYLFAEFLPIYAQHNLCISIHPDSIMMNTKFENAMAYILKIKGRPVTLNLSPATYYFSRENAVSKLYYVSNTTSEQENPDPIKHIALDLHGLKNVTIDGHEATLVMKGSMTDFVVDSCENIRFKNINFDYEHPTLTEMKILECGSDYLIAKVHHDSQYKIEHDRLIWFGNGWSFNKGIAQTYDPIKDITWRSWSPMDGLRRVVESKKNLLFLQYDKQPSAKAGFVFQMRDGIRNEVCGLINNSKNTRGAFKQFGFLSC